MHKSKVNKRVGSRNGEVNEVHIVNTANSRSIKIISHFLFQIAKSKNLD